MILQWNVWPWSGQGRRSQVRFGSNRNATVVLRPGGSQGDRVLCSTGRIVRRLAGIRQLWLIRGGDQVQREVHTRARWRHLSDCVRSLAMGVYG